MQTATAGKVAVVEMTVQVATDEMTAMVGVLSPLGS
jgi:hypothetical protein